MSRPTPLGAAVVRIVGSRAAAGGSCRRVVPPSGFARRPCGWRGSPRCAAAAAAKEVRVVVDADQCEAGRGGAARVECVEHLVQHRPQHDDHVVLPHVAHDVHGPRLVAAQAALEPWQVQGSVVRRPLVTLGHETHRADELGLEHPRLVACASVVHADRAQRSDRSNDSSLVPVPQDQERERRQQAAAKRNGVQPKGRASVHARVHVVGRHAVET
eukprot:scaffold49630_cov57-Phaeocystis_antarctica.AAC.2